MGMFWLFSILLVVVGVLAAYPSIVRTRPDAKEILDKILPYQGYIGIVALIWGALNLLRILLHLGTMTMMPAMWLILALAANVVAVLLGLILGYGLIAQYVLSNSPDARRRGEEWRSKLLPRQVALGWAGVVLGIIGLLLPALM
jgi:hypothetical protein